MIKLIRMPLRGRAWVFLITNVGGLVVIVSPRLLLQWVWWNTTFVPPDWIHWRVK